MIALRPYQEEAIEAVRSAKERNVLRQLISLPTGSGKTVIFGALARQIDTKTLILAHRDELIQQAVDKLEMVWPGVDIGVVKAGRNEFGHQVTVASVQSLTRPKRLAKLEKCDLLITDEAHHAVAPTYRRIYDWLGEILHVGVTATPKRGDKAGLSDVYDEVVYHKGLLEMIRSGYLCDLRGLQVRTDVDLSDLRTVAGDFVERDLAQAVNTSARNSTIVSAWQEYAEGRKTLVFTVNVAHAEALARTFRLAGVAATAISGRTHPEVRRDMLERFANGNVDVLCNCQLLTEGYDEPAVDCIVVARPTQSQSCYLQMIGRGTRLFPGKADCLIVDVADNSRRHSLVQLPSLFGLAYKAADAGRPAAKTVLEQIEEREQVKQGYRAENVDLFHASRFMWQPVGNGFFLSLPGQGQIKLSPATGGYVATLYHKNLVGNVQTMLTDRPLDLGWAQGIAEDEARRLLDGKVGVLVRNARWRGDPITPRQIEVLQKMLIRFDPGITKGEASELITARIAQRQLVS